MILYRYVNNAPTKFQAKSFMMLWHGDDLKFHHVLDEDDMEKAKSGNPRIR